MNAETLQQHFVHLGNLPEDGYREFEVVCVGLRFGKVDHYVVLKNRNKVSASLCPAAAPDSKNTGCQQCLADDGCRKVVMAAGCFFYCSDIS